MKITVFGGGGINDSTIAGRLLRDTISLRAFDRPNA